MCTHIRAAVVGTVAVCKRARDVAILSTVQSGWTRRTEPSDRNRVTIIRIYIYCIHSIIPTRRSIPCIPRICVRYYNAAMKRNF